MILNTDENVLLVSSRYPYRPASHASQVIYLVLSRPTGLNALSQNFVESLTSEALSGESTERGYNNNDTTYR